MAARPTVVRMRVTPTRCRRMSSGSSLYGCVCAGARVGTGNPAHARTNTGYYPINHSQQLPSPRLHLRVDDVVASVG